MIKDFTLKLQGDDISIGSNSTVYSNSGIPKDIVIENLDNKTQIIFNNMNVPLDQHNHLLQINQLLNKIQKNYDKKYNNILKDQQVSLYDDLSDSFINLGVQPHFNQQLIFTVEQFRNSKTLYFQLTSKYQIQSFHKIQSAEELNQQDVASMSCIKEESQKVQEQCGSEPQQKLKKKRNMCKEKRIKERSIQDVRDKVVEWRQIQENQKINLDKAAKIIGISRKTLDDYCLQLRKAREFGFDFIQHKNAKMGVLRKFVKAQEQKAAAQKKKDQEEQQKIALQKKQLQESGLAEIEEYFDLEQNSQKSIHINNEDKFLLNEDEVQIDDTVKNDMNDQENSKIDIINNNNEIKDNMNIIDKEEKIFNNEQNIVNNRSRKMSQDLSSFPPSEIQQLSSSISFPEIVHQQNYQQQQQIINNEIPIEAFKKSNEQVDFPNIDRDQTQNDFKFNLAFSYDQQEQQDQKAEQNNNNININLVNSYYPQGQFLQNSLQSLQQTQQDQISQSQNNNNGNLINSNFTLNCSLSKSVQNSQFGKQNKQEQQNNSNNNNGQNPFTFNFNNKTQGNLTNSVYVVDNFYNNNNNDHNNANYNNNIIF